MQREAAQKKKLIFQQRQFELPTTPNNVKQQQITSNLLG